MVTSLALVALALAVDLKNGIGEVGFLGSAISKSPVDCGDARVGVGTASSHR